MDTNEVTKIPSEISFVPKFQPGTMVFYYKTDDKENIVSEEVISPRENERRYMGQILGNKEDALEYGFALRRNSDGHQAEKTVSAILTEDFIKEFDDLINYYKIPNLFEKSDHCFDLGKFALFCQKYGSPFEIEYNKYIPLFNLYWAFSALEIFLLRDFEPKIHDICRVFSSIIEREAKERQLTDFFISFTPSQVADVLNILKKNFPEHIQESVSWPYLYHDIFPEIGFLIDKKEDIEINNLMAFKTPNLKIHCRYSDLEILREGKTTEKKRWFKERVFENLTSFIGAKPVKILYEGDRPIIQTVIDDPLLYFIFELLVHPTKYTRCLCCKELLTNGTKYCNKAHKEKYRQSTPEGKLDNLIRQWSKRSDIGPEKIDKLREYGLELIDNGKDYKMEVLPLLQNKMKEYRNNKNTAHN